MPKRDAANKTEYKAPLVDSELTCRRWHDGISRHCRCNGCHRLRALLGSDSQNLGIFYLAIFLVPVALFVGGIAGAWTGMSWVTRNGNCEWGIVTQQESFQDSCWV